MFYLDVRGRPAPQGSKKGFATFAGSGADRQVTGIRQVEMSPHVKTWRGDVKDAAEKLTKADGYTLLDGPLRVRMVFTVHKPKNRPKRRRTWPDSMPDLSKLCRATEDALTAAGVWKDDARVVEYARLAKVFPGEDPDSLPVPGVRIWVEQVTEEGLANGEAVG